jgi:hypothetical protein
MGLALEVGVLVHGRTTNEEARERHRSALERLNPFLDSYRVPNHHEPNDGEVWSGDMLGYSGLHDLRRLAVYLDGNRTLPPPAARDGDSTQDPLMQSYYREVEGRRPGLLRRLLGRLPNFRRQFDHLLIHSDAEGYYLPLDFSDVLFPPLELEIPGSIVGSVPRLFAELERIARALAIPKNLEASSRELPALAESPLAEGEPWQRYGRETHACVMLREGCRRAMATGSALVFT